MNFNHIFILWNQSDFHPLNFSQIFIPLIWSLYIPLDSVVRLISWYAPTMLTQTAAVTVFIQWKQSHLHPLKLSLIHIPCNAVTFSSCEFSEILSFEIQSHVHHHEIQSRPHPMKFTSNINFMIWTSYSHPNYCTHCFNPMTIGHIFIPWKQSHLHSIILIQCFHLMEFFNLLLGC